MKKKRLILIVFLLILAYALFNGKNIILGPRIQINSPKQGEIFEETLIKVTGNIQNGAFIRLDGRQIFVDREGNFAESILLESGENVVEIFAKDRFNKEKIERIFIYKK